MYFYLPGNSFREVAHLVYAEFIDANVRPLLVSGLFDSRGEITLHNA